MILCLVLRMRKIIETFYLKRNVMFWAETLTWSWRCFDNSCTVNYKLARPLLLFISDCINRAKSLQPAVQLFLLSKLVTYGGHKTIFSDFQINGTFSAFHQICKFCSSSSLKQCHITPCQLVSKACCSVWLRLHSGCLSAGPVSASFTECQFRHVFHDILSTVMICLGLGKSSLVCSIRWKHYLGLVFGWKRRRKCFLGMSL